MSLQDLLALSGVPGLGAAATILTTTYTTLENIKVYKQQCQELSARCVKLMLALRDSSTDLEGTRAIEFADEMTVVVRRIDRKVNQWAKLTLVKSFLQQRDVKDGINSLHRDLDAAMMQFHIQSQLEITKSNNESRLIQQRDKEELRDLLQRIVRSTDELMAIRNMESSRPEDVEQIMESLQKELMEPDLPPNQEITFRDSLWWLHEKTAKLPPLTDLTGQVTATSDRAVANGTFNNIYPGQWLGKEKVALRQPKTLMNNLDVQKRFQREVAIWRSLHHENVLPLYGVVYIREQLYSVSPWMDNGTAIEYVQLYPEVDRLRILRDVAAGLKYLHDETIVHGDLRGANILVSMNGTARLSDFGLSKFLEDCGQGMTFAQGINPRWFAPELLLSNGTLSTHCDIWSFGMVCLELLTGEQPFSNISRDITVQRELDHGKLPSRPGRQVTARGLDEEMWSLMKKCWQKKPESRPSMKEVREKLSQLRPITAPAADAQSPSKRRSLFGLRRPSTADSKASSSSGSISPLSINIPDGGLRTFGNVRTSRQPSSGDSLGIIVESNPAEKFSPAFDGPPHLELAHLSPSSLTVPLRPHRAQSLNSAPSIMRSVNSNSSDSGVYIPAALKDAVADMRPIVNIDKKSGSVLSGTLEGLVDRLINNFNRNKDMEYRDIFLVACVDFATSEDVFSILTRRFHDAELDTNMSSENRVHLQYNIFMILMYWVSSRRLHVDSQLLWQMRSFCEHAVRTRPSRTMVDKADDVLQAIHDRSTRDIALASPSLSPGRRIPKASEILPHDLAIALALLEGDRYKNILPGDYLAHLRRLPISNNVEQAYLTNNKIVLWVKQSVLHYDKVELRAEVLKFFVNTAHECRKFHNFASLSAIATALHSAPIDRLRLTKEELTPTQRRKLDELDDIVNPAANHRGYREAVNQALDSDSSNVCIPWLAVHLRELHLVLHQNPPAIEVDGHPQINFQRYTKFMDRMREILHYNPPDLEQYRQQGQLAYLEHQLRGVRQSDAADELLMERSIFLEARETRDHTRRKRELRSLGFDISNY